MLLYIYIYIAKHCRRPVFAKRGINTKKVLCYIFFSCDGIAADIPAVPKGKGVTGWYYQDILNSSRNIILNGALCQDKVMVVYFMKIFIRNI